MQTFSELKTSFGSPDDSAGLHHVRGLGGACFFELRPMFTRPSRREKYRRGKTNDET
jgi:hypothetical protein